MTDAFALITPLQDSVSDGVDLAGALDREFCSAPVVKPSSTAARPTLPEKFQDDLIALSQIKDVP